MNNFKKIICINLITVIIGFTSIGIVFATTETDLQKQKNSIDEQIEETNSEIAGVKSKMTVQLNEITSLNSQISDYESEIKSLEEQQSTLNSKISEKETELANKETEYEENKELLEKRLVAMYKSGKTTYLEVLLSAKDISDFLSKYYLIAKLTEYDTSLLEKISEQKDEIAAYKENLESQKAELAASLEKATAKKEALAVTTREKQKVVNNLSAEEKELNKQLEQFEADKKEIQNELSKIAQKESSKNSSNTETSNAAPSSYGYIFPIPGLSKSNINNKSYPSYTGHNGVDINISVVGKNVVAVKAGTVEISTALKNSDGSYKSYGEYITINHHDGTQTLYAHLLAGSRKVSPGQEVSQGQIIGTVGSTGNSTGPHLHFGVYINSKRSFVNPLSYLP
jgi:murein DD-endopeptidase MepM/ murein hydrolase activator NlpD